MNILNLTLKKQCFDQVKNGQKKVEYREYKPYWNIRLENKKYTHIKFRNGYNADSPVVVVEYLGFFTVIYEDRRYYCLLLGDIISSK